MATPLNIWGFSLLSNILLIQSIKNTLSAARLGTYEKATGVSASDDPSALALYAWNAQVSGALMTPLHLCEVVIRNAVADAIEFRYGERWPWSPGFEQSLPNPEKGYSPRKDLIAARRGVITTSKVIPQLKFVFWQKMFTQRHDSRLWEAHLTRVFPNLDPAAPVAQMRLELFETLGNLRDLRNRIAHHEPVFARRLSHEFHEIVRLIELRCRLTAAWMVANQQASSHLANRPRGAL